MERKAIKDENYLLNNYNENVKLNPFYQIEKILSISKNKIVKLVRNDVIEIHEYVWYSIYTEIIILVLIFILALVCNVVIPTLIIVSSFLLSRLLFKGDHLNSLNKCTIFTIAYLFGFSYISTILVPINMNILLKLISYVMIGIVLELFSLTMIFKKVLNKIDNY
jgi:accessory gene regulator protein AgrB